MFAAANSAFSLGRRLTVARADHEVDRHLHLVQPGLIHPEHLDNSRRHRKGRFDSRIGVIEGRGRIHRYLVTQMLRHHPMLFFQPR